jgi:dTDP-glucose pyrophosphorylase/histidinol phosphatase-like enzyme
MNIPRQCAVLAGGTGTRLGQLTADTPKTLLDCGGRPFIAWVLRELTRFGIEEVIFLAGHKSDSIQSFCTEAAACLPKPLSIKISIEPFPAGTGGALWHARDLLDDRFLLINGDSWIDTNLARFLSVSPAPQDLGCVLLREMNDCTRYGTVELLGNRIAAFREKSSGSASGIINSGIYVLDKAVIDFLSPKCSIETDMLPALASKRALSGFVMDGYFIDIGIPSDYARAGKELPGQLTRPAVIFDWDGVLSEDSGGTENESSLHWAPGAKEAVRLVNDKGGHVFVAVRQTGESCGRETDAKVESLHRQILQDVLPLGGTVDDICFIPSLSTDRVAANQSRSPHSGTLSGSLSDRIARWGVESTRSVFIGKSGSDLHAPTSEKIKCHQHVTGTQFDFLEPLVNTMLRDSNRTIGLCQADV